MFLTRRAQFHGSELEALLLKPLDDLANETSLHTIRLNHDEGALLGDSIDSLKIDLLEPFLLHFINNFNIINKLTLEADNLAQLLDAWLSILRVVDDKAVGLLGRMLIETTVVSCLHMLSVSLIRVMLTVLGADLLHVVVVHGPHLLERHTLRFHHLPCALEVLREQNWNVNL